MLRHTNLNLGLDTNKVLLPLRHLDGDVSSYYSLGLGEGALDGATSKNRIRAGVRVLPTQTDEVGDGFGSRGSTPHTVAAGTVGINTILGKVLDTIAILTTSSGIPTCRLHAVFL